MTKKRLLIICKHQLGTLTDVFKWCYYLRNDYDVTLLCFDTGYPKVTIDGIQVKYVNYQGSFKVRGLRFILNAIWTIFLFFKGEILVVYFEHCELLKKIFRFKKLRLDIRTLSVSQNEAQRERTDRAIITACKCYDAVSVISEGVRKKIGNIGHEVNILPLGSDCISCVPKKYAELHLIYVGTFNGRQLDKTIKGVSIFCKRNPTVSITYDIIGSGDHNELQLYEEMRDTFGLNSVITFHGRVANHLLSQYFDRTNIGVSFVPITDYYNYQPPTKTFEYILSGLYTIATATDANKEIINSDNGILIKDTAEDFANALEYIFNNKDNFSYSKIKESLSDYTWEKIVDNNLKPLLLK